MAIWQDRPHFTQCCLLRSQNARARDPSPVRRAVNLPLRLRLRSTPEPLPLRSPLRLPLPLPLS
jgi:hypothetical protein